MSAVSSPKSWGGENPRSTVRRMGVMVVGIVVALLAADVFVLVTRAKH